MLRVTHTIAVMPPFIVLFHCESLVTLGSALLILTASRIGPAKSCQERKRSKEIPREVLMGVFLGDVLFGYFGED